MADEGWSYARTDGSPAPMTRYTDAAESGTGVTSTGFQPSLHDGAAASPSSFLADDPHMNWTQDYMGRRAATASFNAFLQHHGDADAGGRFLLDQTPPRVHAHQYDYDGAAPVAAAPRSYAGNQCSSSARSCSDMRAAAMMTKPFPQQQLSGFPGSSGNFGTASEPPPILSQVRESKHLLKTEGVEEACSTVMRSSSGPDSPGTVKKRRIETPSPLPTFKVRKEKLGDRITALQQLVSPFGKTDTASVLHETIEYIKFLHEQVASLSSPYLRCGRPVQLPQQQGSTKAKNGEAKDDLRSRGLCLVPVASTGTVANETAMEFWHPTFDGTFR